ncbi:hypothetical protein P4555_08860 [Peribacillus frigoritolerans]|uniref:hypothetical protein n=2 Tax=Peribacillus frigoritolerans TaxID=450367 RepID=UPI002E2450A1|nr:hypothetical protein [Peribacillus frigoritolerans]
MMSGRAVPQGAAFHFRNGIVMKGMTWHKRIGIVRTVHEESDFREGRSCIWKQAVSLTETFLSFIMGECKDIGRQQSCILNGRKQRLGK